MLKHSRRVIALLTALVLLLSLTGCEFLEERKLNKALEALENEDFSQVLELVKENDSLVESKDLTRAVKRFLKNLASQLEDEELDFDDVEEILEEMEDLLDELDNDDLFELAEELLSGNSVPSGNQGAVETTAPLATEGLPAVEDSGTITGVAVIADPYIGYEDPITKACLAGVENWCSANYVDYYAPIPLDDSTDAIISAIEQSIAQGYNVIILPGYLYGGAICLLQDVYPNIFFIGIDMVPADLTVDYYIYSDPADNTACITFAMEEAGFMAGYAAVMEGFTNLAFMGAMDFYVINQYRSGFLQGAEAAAAEIGVVIEFTTYYANQYYGNANITAAAEELYRNGTEVIFVCGGSLYTSVMEAAESCGCYLIGSDLDTTGYSRSFLTCAVKDYSLATETVLEMIQAGHWYLYSGQHTILSLVQGDYMALSTGIWPMQNFTIKDYEKLRERIQNEEFSISPEY